MKTGVLARRDLEKRILALAAVALLSAGAACTKRFWIGKEITYGEFGTVWNFRVGNCATHKRWAHPAEVSPRAVVLVLGHLISGRDAKKIADELGGMSSRESVCFETGSGERHALVVYDGSLYELAVGQESEIRRTTNQETLYEESWAIVLNRVVLSELPPAAKTNANGDVVVDHADGLWYPSEFGQVAPGSNLQDFLQAYPAAHEQSPSEWVTGEPMTTHPLSWANLIPSDAEVVFRFGANRRLCHVEYSWPVDFYSPPEQLIKSLGMPLTDDSYGPYRWHVGTLTVEVTPPRTAPDRNYHAGFTLIGCESLGPDELDTDSDALDRSCRLNSDCPDQEKCADGQCLLECREDVDCPGDQRCGVNSKGLAECGN